MCNCLFRAVCSDSRATFKGTALFFPESRDAENAEAGTKKRLFSDFSLTLYRAVSLGERRLRTALDEHS